MREQCFLESDWDYCIVLDACRYDVFEELYDGYLEGTLEKRWSTGSSTPEWAYRTFTGEHDIAYFSANPFINSLGIPLDELNWGASCEYPWAANDHLREVIDVWKHGWDDDLGTVPPEALLASFGDHRAAVEHAERTVLHFMQPHAPYLSRGDGRKLRLIRKGIRKQDDERSEGTGRGLISSFGDAIRPRLERVLDRNRLAMKAGLWLELEPGRLLRDGTRETAMTHYEENLKIALEVVADLVDDLDGRVIVTSDHGEAFGEGGIWEHHIETHIPALMEVPWLELSNR